MKCPMLGRYSALPLKDGTSSACLFINLAGPLVSPSDITKFARITSSSERKSLLSGSIKRKLARDSVAHSSADAGPWMLFL